MEKIKFIVNKIKEELEIHTKKLNELPPNRWQISHERELQINTLETKISTLEEILNFIDDNTMIDSSESE